MTAGLAAFFGVALGGMTHGVCDIASLLAVGPHCLSPARASFTAAHNAQTLPKHEVTRPLELCRLPICLGGVAQIWNAILRGGLFPIA